MVSGCGELERQLRAERLRADVCERDLRAERSAAEWLPAKLLEDDRTRHATSTRLRELELELEHTSKSFAVLSSYTRGLQDMLISKGYSNLLESIFDDSLMGDEEL